MIIAHNSSRQNKYVQKIVLNGKPLDQIWFRHVDIVDRGTLELTMADTPNKELGSKPKSFPLDAMNVHPEDSR